MTVVLDASLALAWFFEDEQNATVRAALDAVAEAGAIVPSIWPLEVANALTMAMRRGRIDGRYRSLCLGDLGALPIAVDVETSQRAWHDTLALADRYRLSLYDAAYLELTARSELPLASADAALKAAAKAAGCRLFPS